MSVINRMLADLERRGAPGARNAPGPGGRGRPRRCRHWRQWLQRGLPAVLLVALMLVAGALWRERAPDVLALMERARSEVQPDAAAPEPDRGSAPTVTAIAFEAADGDTHLTVDFSRALPEPPGYHRTGERLVLRMPAIFNGRELPTPPSDSAVFRSVAVSATGEGATRLALTVAADARFDLSHGGERLRITGRRPRPREENEAQATEAAAAEEDGSSGGVAADPATAEPDGSADPENRASAAEPSPESAEAVQGDSAEGSAPEPTAADEGTIGEGTTRDAAAGDEPERDRVAVRDADAGATDDAGDAAEAGDGEIRKSEPTLTAAERARELESEARAAVRTGDTRRAREQLRAALAADPDRHSARDLLVRLALRADDTKAARNLLVNGLQRASRRAGFAKPYARLLVDAGELERALRVLERARPGGDGDAGYHGLKAAIAQRLERHELAAEAYTRALGIDRDRGVWWLGLGISLAATDRPEQARTAFRKARASGDLDPRLDEWAGRRIEALSQE